MPKVTKKKNSQARHRPLERQLEDDDNPKYRSQPRQKQRHSGKGGSDDEEFVPENISKKILAVAREQQAELDEEMKEKKIVVEGSGKWAAGGRNQRKPPKKVVDDSSDEDDGSDLIEEDSDAEELVRFDGDDVEIVEIDGDDEAAIERFMFPERFERRDLADVIMNRIREKEEEADEEGMTSGELIEQQFDPKVLEVYKQVGKILSHYTSGKLPKAFKIIPSLRNWEQVLYITEPENWTPIAVGAATKIFASNLNAKMAQRFYNLILLPRLRMDIGDNKKLNFHLYLALKKALYKPQAWFKGVLLPLCEEGNATLREATIIGSVISKVSVPVLHSAAALLRLAEMPYTGANSIFIRILLNKKYSLPRRVVDATAEHFVKFIGDERQLPVLWHQALLVFAQRYRNEIQDKHKELLKELMRKHFHPQITPEIRRELFGAAVSHYTNTGVDAMDL